MFTRLIPAALIGAAFFVGCGATSEEEKIRDVNLQFITEVENENLADACALTDKPEGCMSAMMLANALAGGVRSLIPRDLTEQVEEAEVTVNGNRAVLNNNGDTTEMVKRDDEWLIVFEETS